MKKTGSFLLAAVLAAVLGLTAAPRADAAPASVQTRLAPSQFADDGLGLEGTSTYTIDPAARSIHVLVDLVAENLVAPQYGYYVIRYAYFDQVGLPVLVEATNLAATAEDGSPLNVTIESEPDHPVAFAVVDLPRNLEYQDRQAVRLTYDLPDQGPRAAGITRVNPAYAAVVPIPVGDPGWATVRVNVPKGLSVEQLGASPLPKEGGTDPVTYAADAISDPITWDAMLVARDYDAMDVTHVESDSLQGHAVEVRSWPGDTEWANFVAGIVRDDLPVLQELIGQDWPVERTLRIDETVSPYVYGYAGWYDTAVDTIEIGDQLDAQTVLHELSHAWFNRELFGERWINEGLAEEYAARTIERGGDPLLGPDPVAADDPGVVRLTDWSNPSLSSETSEAQERYGYNAAFSVIHDLYAELGPERMADVIDAAARDRIAYQGDTDPEEAEGRNDWRRFLDLLQNIGGSQHAEPDFAGYVVPQEDMPLLAERTQARAALEALTTAGAGWTAPLVVREAMAAWKFVDAGIAMEGANAVLAVRDRIAAAVAPLDLSAPVGLEGSYQSADDLDDVLDDAEALLAVTDELVDADAAASAGHGGLAAIGLLNGADDDAYGDAVAAFTAGDAPGVLDASARAQQVVDDAAARGLAAMVGLVLALAVGLVALRTLRRSARSRALARVQVGLAPG